MKVSPPRSRTMLPTPFCRSCCSSASTAPTVAMSSSPRGETTASPSSRLTWQVNGPMCCDNTCPPIGLMKNKHDATETPCLAPLRVRDRTLRAEALSRIAILHRGVALPPALYQLDDLLGVRIDARQRVVHAVDLAHEPPAVSP